MSAFSGRERTGLAIVAIAFVAAAVTHGMDGLVPFFTSLVALAGVAWLVSFATDLLGEHFGPAVTGFLQSSLGNMPELFVVIAALSAGETEIALTSLIGSVLANALLMLGIAIIVGARVSEDGMMRFSARLPNDTATLLQVAVFGIVLVGLVESAQTRAAEHVTTISSIASVCLLLVYLAWAVPYLKSDTRPGESAHGGPRVSLGVCIAMLAVAAALAAFVSEWFISALTPAIEDLNISKAFAGLVIVAIAGNAAENVTGIIAAARGQADLAISVIKNSVAQVAALLFPLLVLISLGFDQHLTFQMPSIYVGGLALGGLAVWQITGDGEAAAYEGVALVALFVILGAFALYS
ncbi:MAG: Ca2+:H+ antiporter [Solirubrobacteraceae bacterium]|jgi:Ca2+:H+ antiporter|nr:Ca2+:H+ antiporter [Solirubrobacteraceae bacterium]